MQSNDGRGAGPAPARRVPRPYTAETPTKTIRFEGERGKRLARAVEIQAAIDDEWMNDVLLRLIELGLQERQRQKPGGGTTPLSI